MRELIVFILLLLALGLAGESDRHDAEIMGAVDAEICLAAAEGRDVRAD